MPSACNCAVAAILVVLVSLCPAQTAHAQAQLSAVPVSLPDATTNSAMVPRLAPRFMAKHQANLDVAGAGGGELLLIGDSITEFWRNTDGPFAGQPVLQKYFGHWSVANFGIASDTTQGVLYRLQNGEGRGFSPRAIMLLIGTNNLGQNSPAEIADGIGAVVLELMHDFPAARILLLGLFPRGPADDPMRNEIAEINQRIAHYADGVSVCFLDIGKHFLDENGNIPAEVMSDGLHPAPKGYEIWAKAVRAPLTALMAQDQKPSPSWPPADGGRNRSVASSGSRATFSR